jgi:hypothetical protein
LPASSDLRRASMDMGFSTNALGGGGLQEVVSTRGLREFFIITH